ncbi:hypothetical protein POPTR_011G080201v4 [Populus trichocarpa]|uniref:Uncharacterized protein n=1 Tax=Populus trichocarpa TaxID=3694 RepID=A0ACC0S849_POPTR|nr:hypothetical protein POPTR_011G080201v4 [Populus trichocarpa]
MDQCIKNGKINGCHPTRFKLICGGHIHTYKRKNKGDKTFVSCPPLMQPTTSKPRSQILLSHHLNILYVLQRRAVGQNNKNNPLPLFFLTESLGCPCHNNA